MNNKPRKFNSFADAAIYIALQFEARKQARRPVKTGVRPVYSERFKPIDYTLTKPDKNLFNPYPLFND